MMVDRGALRRSERLGWEYVRNVRWNNRSVWLGNHTLQAIALQMLWFAMPQSPRDDDKHRPLQTRVRMAAHILRFSTAG